MEGCEGYGINFVDCPIFVFDDYMIYEISAPCYLSFGVMFYLLLA